MDWESRSDINTSVCVNQIAGGKLLNNTGAQPSARDDLEWGVGDGGGEGGPEEGGIYVYM